MREISSSVLWLARVMLSLVASFPLSMALGVVLSLAGHVTHVLAFLLPLKVILLAGSDGVPSYFRPFIADDQKTLAVVVLSVGAALCFGLSLFLDNVVKRLSSMGGAQISEKSNAVYIVNNQSDETGNVLLQFMQLASSGLFVSLALGVLAWLSPLLLACIVGAIFVSAAFLALTSSSATGNPKSSQEVAATLKVLAAIAFFVCFGVVLLPFVMSSAGASVPIAIISFILLRRILGTLPSAVRQAMKLVSNRLLISALVFRHHPLRKDEGGVGRSFRESYDRPVHLARLREVLGGEVPPDAELDRRWIDTAEGRFHTFEIEARLPGASRSTRFLERVMLPGRGIFAENEQFLFEHVSREALKAPPLVARYREGNFESLVSRIGLVEPDPTPTDGLINDLTEDCWSIEPPEQLRRAYSVSHPLLPARLTGQLVARCAVAVDTDEERRTFELFGKRLARLRRFLCDVPLYIHNPHLQKSYVYVAENGGVILPSWGLWSLEPIGAVLPEEEDEVLCSRIARVRERRHSIPAEFGLEELRLVNNAARLERRIGKDHFKKAFDIMAKIIAAEPLRRMSAGSRTAAMQRSSG